jgi:SsrA-binding protein
MTKNKKKVSKSPNKDIVFATNKRARYDITTESTFIAGISLLGREVKSIRQGSCSLQDSYIKLSKNGNKIECFWINGHIREYQSKRRQESQYEETRSRKLLLNKQELLRLSKLLSTKGSSAVPIRLINSRNWIKLEFIVGTGKSKIDKRELIKKRDLERENSI